MTYLVYVYSVIGGIPINHAGFTTTDDLLVPSTRDNPNTGYMLPDGYYVVGVGRRQRLTTRALGFEPVSIFTDDIDENTTTITMGLPPVMEMPPPPPPPPEEEMPPPPPPPPPPPRGWIELTRNHDLGGNPTPYIDQAGAIQICWIDLLTKRLYHIFQQGLGDRGAWSEFSLVTGPTGAPIEASPDFEPVVVKNNRYMDEIHLIGPSREEHIWICNTQIYHDLAIQWSEPSRRSLPVRLSAAQGSPFLMQDGLVQMFIPTRDTTLYSGSIRGREYNTQWPSVPFEEIGGGGRSVIATSFCGLYNSVLELFAIGPSGVTATISATNQRGLLGNLRVDLPTVWHLRRDESRMWGNWENLGLYGSIENTVPGRPIHITVRRHDDGRLEVFVMTTKRDGPFLFHTWQVSPGSLEWSGWMPINVRGRFTLTDSGLGVNCFHDRRTVLFTVGSDGTLWYLSQQRIATMTDPNPPWGNWSHIPGNLLSFTPSILYCTDGTLAFIGRNHNGQLVHARQLRVGQDPYGNPMF